MNEHGKPDRLKMDLQQAEMAAYENFRAYQAERETREERDARLTDIEMLARESRDADIWKLRELMDRICTIAAGRPAGSDERRAG